MSTTTIPPSFLFRYAVACRQVAKLPTGGSRIAKLGKECRLPCFATMDGQVEFATVWMGWNAGGIGVAFEVLGKEHPVHAEPAKPTGADGMSLWIDTRDARTIHRASRYCQRFLILANDGSDAQAPTAFRKSIKRAIEEPAAIDESQIRIARFALERGKVLDKDPKEGVKSYRLEVFFPASVLVGFDPENIRRLGVFYRVRDRELGDQLLAAAREIPYWEDPSLWPTLVLE